MYKLNKYDCLDVSYKNLTSLGELPVDITTLHCTNNELTSLSELPDSLKILRCYHNKLTFLPKLPTGLRCLDCSSNQITFLPELPDGLESLFCNDNPLECVIPEQFFGMQDVHWMFKYYIPYIGGYEGQKNILSREPWMAGELKKQVDIRYDIMEEFDYLFNGCELNLL